MQTMKKFDTRKPIFGYIFTLFGFAICWKPNFQMVTLSTIQTFTNKVNQAMVEEDDRRVRYCEEL